MNSLHPTLNTVYFEQGISEAEVAQRKANFQACTTNGTTEFLESVAYINANPELFPAPEAAEPVVTVVAEPASTEELVVVSAEPTELTTVQAVEASNEKPSVEALIHEATEQVAKDNNDVVNTYEQAKAGGEPIDTEEIHLEEVIEWQKTVEELNRLKLKERRMRDSLLERAFTTVKEGSGNKFKLENDYILQATKTVTREVDAGVFASSQVKLMEAGLPMDELVDFLPKLKKAVWNKLNDNDKKLFAECIIEKDGSPSLKYVLPKK